MVRVVEPPARVWIDLTGLLAPGPHHVYHHVPGGLQTRYETQGILTEWMPGENGDWLGRVTYSIASEDNKWSTSVSHYVPSHLIRPRSRIRRRRAR